MSPNRLTQARRRIGSRGAVAAEFVVYVPVLLILYVGMVFTFGVFDAKLKTLRGARRVAWQHATLACEGGASASPDVSVGSGGGDGSLAAANAHTAAARSIARGRTLTEPLETDLKVGAATATAFAQGQSNGFATFTGVRRTTTTQVLCNEEQAPISEGDVRATINSLYGQWL